MHLKVGEEARIRSNLPMSLISIRKLDKFIGESRNCIENLLKMTMNCFPAMLEFKL